MFKLENKTNLTFNVIGLFDYLGLFEIKPPIYLLRHNPD